MKLFVFLLIIACLLQASVVPANFALILLVSRSLIIDEKNNLYLALFTGLLLGLLMSINIGFYALVFVLYVEIVHLVKKSPISANILTVVPLTFVLLLALSYLEELILNQSFNLSPLLIQSLIALPFFVAVKFWEERFVVSPPLKLKM
jgi:cell shape-determining protein MreD